MRRFLLTVVPLAMAAVTIYLLKPSEETCRKVATEKLSAANLPAANENIIVQDYFFMRTLKYVHNGDTSKLGSAAFLQVRVKDGFVQDIKAKKK